MEGHKKYLKEVKNSNPQAFKEGKYMNLKKWKEAV